MAIATDRLHTIVTLDAGNYQANANRVVAATAKMKAAGVGDGSVFSKMGSLASSVMPALQIAGTAVAAGLASATVAIGGLGIASLKAYGNLERLTLGLTAVEGSADIAGERLKELRELAKMPGLGFEQAVGAFGQLRNAGASPEFAKAMIREVGNAVARGGGGAMEFGNVMRQVAQTLNRPFLQGEEMNSFREAGLPVDRALRSRFGTSDTEELKRQGVTSVMVLNGIVEEFSKMERVQGGLNNSFENLRDSVNTALAAIGQGLAPGVMQAVETISNAFGELDDSGVLKIFGENLSRIGNELTAAFTSSSGGMGLSEALIEFGAGLIDVTTILGNIGILFMAVARSIPGLNGVLPALNALSGGAGAEFRAEALSALDRYRNSPQTSTVGEELASQVTRPNPVQEQQLRIQEQIEKNTAELVRFQQTAFGGGELLRRGISISDANRFNRGGGGSSNARNQLVLAIEALIAQNVARAN